MSVEPNQTVAHWLLPPQTGEERPGPHSTFRAGEPDRGHEVLARMAADVREGSTVSLERTLGVGGTGEVHLARQEPLGRHVAAKRLRDPTEARELALLQEARILGHLEHPNVVPIHDVTVGSDGRVMLLLKRIEGDEWSHWLRPEANVCGAFDVEDPLYWHLDVLVQISRAVEFAHARGVVHRDLKPDNVMIGRFGEVVLVDWGIAVGLGAGDIAPPVSQARVAGTPVYMAPEMITDPTRIDARTDVYQLGGLLYRILTGAAPHDGAEIAAIATHILESEPALPHTVPDELARIAATALSRSMDGRQPTAAAFRAELQRFLSHRGSVQLTDDADGLLQSPAPDADHLEQARFGYTAALAQWAGNRRARTGLEQTTARLARLRLDDGDVLAAERLIAELDEPEPGLVAAIQAARAEQDRLTAIARKADPTVGAQTRWNIAAFLAVLWMGIPLVGHILGRDRVIDADILLNWSLGLMVATLAAGVYFRDAVRASDLNRKVWGWVVLTPPLQALLTWGLDHGGVHPDRIQAAHFFLWGTTCGTAALGIDPRLALSAVAYLVGFVLVLQAPEQRYLVMFFPNLILTATVAWLYRADRT